MIKVEKTIDILSGEEAITERDETAAETKAALLARLGITADEAKLLL